MSDMVLVRVNCPDEALARRMADTLVGERLAGCANISAPVRSVYRWKGQMHAHDEIVVWLKTLPANAARLCARAAELHTDQAPAILTIDAHSASPAYLRWLGDETGRATSA